MDALKDLNIPVVEAFIVDCVDDNITNYNIIKSVLNTLNPDGVFTSGENLAFVSYKVCHELQIVIPKDLKIISFSSSEVVALLNSSLTTIIQPALEIGSTAANVLFKVLENESLVSEEKIILKSSLIKRESTAFR